MGWGTTVEPATLGKLTSANSACHTEVRFKDSGIFSHSPVTVLIEVLDLFHYCSYLSRTLHLKHLYVEGRSDDNHGKVFKERKSGSTT